MNSGKTNSWEAMLPGQPDFHSLFDLVPTPLLLLMANDPVFTVVCANRAFLELGGLEPNLLVGRGVFEKFPNDPDDAGFQSLLSSFRRAITLRAADRMKSYRHDVLRSAERGGGFEARYWVSTNTPILDSCGDVQFILQSVQEVSELVQAQERADQAVQRLQKNEECYRQIAESSGFGLVIAGQDGSLSYVNPTLLAVLGYTQEEVERGEVHWDKLTPPELARRDTAAWQEVIETGKCAPYEKVYIAKSGAYVPILIGASLLDSDEGANQVAAFVIDLRSRKRSERDAFLVRLDDAIRPVADSGEITQTAARMLAEHLDVDGCTYVDVADDEDTFHLIGDSNRGIRSMAGRYTFSQFGSECSRLLRQGQSYVVEDSEIDSRAAEGLEAYRAAGIRSAICVPLLKADRFVAAMAVHSKSRRHWQAVEISLIEQVANRCWESIERSRIARELRETAERYRFLAQSIPQMVWTATPEGALDYVNDPVTRFFEASSEEVLGSGWLRWVHPEDQSQTVARWTQSLQTGSPYETSFRLLRASDKSWRWHLVRAHALRGVDGAITQWFGTCTDFEDQKQSQVALLEKARLAALGAEIGAALTTIADLRPSLQRCTEVIVDHLDVAFARVWTLSTKKDVLELEASAGLYTHIDGAHARIPVGSFKIGRIAQERRPHLTNDVVNDARISDPEWARQEGMVAFAGYPLVVEDRLVGVLGLFARQPLGSDILTAFTSVSATMAIAIERKRTEAALAQQAVELRRSNEDLEQFANIASHDLQSPLNTVRNFTELVVRRYGASLDSEITKLLELVRDNATRMGELISALLTYSRLSSPESATVRRVSAVKAYDDAVANLQSAIETTQARIERDTLPEVVTNRAQLTQVFQNLISNSINYRGDLPPHIRVTAQREDEFWLFSVIDNGPGIAPEFHSLIFEPFKRLHGQDRPGSGIGLAFCRKFIEREGGTIWVESEQGAGATFRFTLPAARTRADSAER